MNLGELAQWMDETADTRAVAEVLVDANDNEEGWRVLIKLGHELEQILDADT